MWITWGREALGKMERLKIVEPVLGSVSLALDFWLFLKWDVFYVKRNGLTLVAEWASLCCWYLLFSVHLTSVVIRIFFSFATWYMSLFRFSGTTASECRNWRHNFILKCVWLLCSRGEMCHLHSDSFSPSPYKCWEKKYFYKRKEILLQYLYKAAELWTSKWRCCHCHGSLFRVGQEQVYTCWYGQ